MRRTKEQKAITLIALILTIVVLLILAVVAISAIQNDGILSYAQNAANSYNQAATNEQVTIQEYLNFLQNGGLENTEGYEEVALSVAITDAMYDRTENSQTKDIYGNVIKIPAGFKILVDSTTGYTGTTDIAVEKGIVITDEAGNEFVWVPTGSVKTASEIKNIQLARYEFDVTFNISTGSVEGTGAITETHTLAEAEVKDQIMTLIASMNEWGDVFFKEGETEGISDFITKASSGYYIGRYEARTNSTTARAEGENLTEVTLNKANAVYNWIAQQDAKDVCKNMYTEKTFTTDLVNSYAWDTAIAFIQGVGEDTDYSLKQGVNTSFLNTGTVGTETEDKVCNIYDMASNCIEWSTETCNVSETIMYVTRGGAVGSGEGILCAAGGRLQGDEPGSRLGRTFRPVLYL